MHLNAHLTFNGNCEEAFRTYEQCLGGQITTLLTYGASPLAATFPELADKVMHATLFVGNHRISGVDLAASQYEVSRGFTLQLNLEDPEDAWRIFEVLSVEGQVRMPLQKTFWAELFAVVTDRFGTPWEINCSGSV